jgi:hypothetical protein
VGVEAERSKTMIGFNQYEAAESVEIGKAEDMILGEKFITLLDTVIGDPDVMHRPEVIAQCDE